MKVGKAVGAGAIRWMASCRKHIVALILSAGVATSVFAEDVARIGTTTYSSLTAAISAAPDGATIELLKDTESTGSTITKNLTFNGNGHTVTHITGNGSCYNHFLYIVGADNSTIPVTVNLSDIEIKYKSGNSAIYLGSPIEGLTCNLMSGAVITGYRTGTITVKFAGTQLNVYDGAVLDPGFDVDSKPDQHGTVKVHGGTFAVDPMSYNKKYTDAVVLDEGLVVLYMKKVAADDDTPYHVVSKTAVLETGSGTLDLSKATYLADFKGTIVVNEGGTLILPYGCSVGGALQVVDGTISAEGTVPAAGAPIASFAGGIEFPEGKRYGKYAKFGAGSTLSADGKSFISQGSNVARIGGTLYATLVDAISAAPDGATIELLKDTESTGSRIMKDLTFNGNGYTVTHVTGNGASYYHFLYLNKDATSPLTVNLSDIEIKYKSGNQAIYFGVRVDGMTCNLNSGTVITGYRNSTIAVNMTGNVLNVYDGAVLDTVPAFDAESRQGEHGTVNVHGGAFAMNPLSYNVKYADSVVLDEGLVVLHMKKAAADDLTPYHAISKTAVLETGSGKLDLSGATNLAAFMGTIVVNEGGTLILPGGCTIGGKLVLQEGKLMASTSVSEGAALVTANGGVEIAEGCKLDDFIGIPSGSGELSGDGKSIIIHYQDLTIPVFAGWIGGGDRSNPRDPANWACTNMVGTVLPNAIPDAEHTVVTVAGATSFNFPAGSAVMWKELVLGASISLTADCDWRGLSVPYNGKVDLRGHELHVAAFKGTGEFTSGVSGGKLHVDVAENATVNNTSIKLTGQLQLVKDGAGTYSEEKSGHTYSEGLDVVGGKYMCNVGGSGTCGGVDTSTVTVRKGAVLDGYKQGGALLGHHWVLDGGTLMYSTQVVSGGTPLITNVTLTADSCISVPGIYLAIYSRRGTSGNANAPMATLEMNGHTLAIDVSGTRFGMRMCEVTGGGKIVLRNFGSSSMFQLEQTVHAETTAFEVQNAFVWDVDNATVADFKDYISTAAFGSVKDLVDHRVHGRFQPYAGSRWHSVVLQDGATLDLSKQTGTWTNSCTFANVNSGRSPSVARFADNANITVDMGSRKGGKLVDWSENPPANLRTLKFNPVEPSPYLMEAREDGLYAFKGMMVIIR